MKDKAVNSGFVNADALDQFGGKVDNLKSQASDLKDSAIDTASAAGNIVNTDAIKDAASQKLD